MVENSRVVTIVDCVRSYVGSLTYVHRQETELFPTTKSMRCTPSSLIALLVAGVQRG